MRIVLSIFFVIVLTSCASSPKKEVAWTRANTTEEQTKADNQYCKEVAAQVLKESSKKLYKGGISAARSSSTQVSSENEAFEDTPHNRKIVWEHCMEKKKYTKVQK